MLCEKCGKRQANVKYTQIINGHKSSINICSQCAAQESVFENFGSLLSFREKAAAPQSVCEGCGMTLSELSRSGRMGCGQCYNSFRSYADAMLKKIHGTSKHIEENAPKKEVKREKAEKPDPIDSLRAELKAAIEKENFEEAASLRDKIREMEDK